MEAFLDIMTSVDFWKIVVPVLAAMLVWALNETSKRRGEEYKRREESYKELIRTSRGFYVSSAKSDLKTAFLDQLNLCWLYSPDEVIQKAYAFLHLVSTGVQSSDSEKELAMGDLFAAIRKDVLRRKIVRSTALGAADFKHLRTT